MSWIGIRIWSMRKICGSRSTTLEFVNYCIIKQFGHMEGMDNGDERGREAASVSKGLIN